MKPHRWMLLLVIAATAAIYANGLNGPFLFDDYVHITQNQWVKIQSLDWNSLVQAWNSSFSPFPGNRPLAQVSFGINHALSGLDPWAFKTTNLAIHLLNGVLVFVFVRLAYRAVREKTATDPDTGHLLALAAATLWLLHPIHVSTVLYAVQRMALLSTLFLLLGLSAYFWGRLRIARGESGAVWMIAAAPIAMVGFLAKENTVLLPLMLLASEITLLRNLSCGQRQTLVRGIWVLFIALPLLAGLLWFVTHPGLLAYQGRPFSMDERLLTQPRILWLYLRWLYIPDISAFGLFHDDIVNSTSLLSPPTTLFAIIGLVALAAAAIGYRRRAPVFAFAVLFFLACHTLESSVLPLEMVFEHRNYLASLGPLFFLAYLIVIVSVRMNVRSLALTVGGLLLISYGVVTHIRVDNWSSYQDFMLSAAKNHPDSPRSNFMAAQMLISAVDNSEDNAAVLADAARTFLNQGLAADPHYIDCLFGLVVLDLHRDQQPDPEIIARLTKNLRTGYVGPTKVSLSQFSYLVKWQRGSGTRLAADDLEAIFEAALSNPGWGSAGRAGIEAAYREYYEFVALDLESALKHAKTATRFSPKQWNYHMNLVRVLRKLQRTEAALAAVQVAGQVAGNERQRRETELARAEIEHELLD